MKTESVKKRLNWVHLDPCFVDGPSMFGFEPTVVRVARWHGGHDIRAFSLRGWASFADLLEIDPVTRRRLKEPVWFVFTGKRVNRAC